MIGGVIIPKDRSGKQCPEKASDLSESTHLVAGGGENQNPSLYVGQLLCGIELLKTEGGLGLHVYLAYYLFKCLSCVSCSLGFSSYRFPKCSSKKRPIILKKHTWL